MSYHGIINWLETHLLPCSVRELTGYPCPGCGMQSACIALLRGDLWGSVMANPALLPFLFTVVYTALHLRFNFSNGARNVLVLFCSTVSLMIVNYIGSSGLLRYL